MSTTELKAKLISEISEIENEQLLKEIYQLLEFEREDSTPYPLTEKQLSILTESEMQVDRGEFLTGEEANKEIDEWLKK